MINAVIFRMAINDFDVLFVLQHDTHTHTTGYLLWFSI